MLRDLKRVGAASSLEADICIVGGGAAGITLAKELYGTFDSIILIEGGGTEDDLQAQSLYGGESVGHPIDLDVGRYRVFGGSTSRWTGRCAKLDRIDFEYRNWIPFSGWPITLQDLESYYERSIPFCGFTRGWPEDLPNIPGSGDANRNPDVANFTWLYAPLGNRKYLNWAEAYGKDLIDSRSVDVLVNANAVGMEIGENRGEGASAVSAIRVRSFSGEEIYIKARFFVIACGGIENARLLLEAAREHETPFRSVKDSIGRFFMQHPRGVAGKLAIDNAQADKLQDFYNIFAKTKGLQYEIGFALSAAAQERNQLLNCSGIFSYQSELDSEWDAFKRVVNPQRRVIGHTTVLSDISTVVRRPKRVIRNLCRRAIFDRHALIRSSEVDFIIDLEQVPDPESRVTLSDKQDALGSHMPRVDWRISEQERVTARFITEAVARHLHSLDFGQLRPLPWLYDGGAVKPQDLSGTFHHIATTRMSASPKDGVVDKDCRVHGFQNLFMAGCSVFATGGHANPTLTIVALAIRLADYLKSTLRQPL
jgi:choline dehydrogenase-like flavoprotein